MSAALHVLRHEFPRLSKPACRSNPVLKQRKSSGSAIFSHHGSAEFLAAATTIKAIPALDGLPEVVVTGRANVGKSTFLNAVLGRKNLVHTSKKAGHTRALNFFAAGGIPSKLVVVDAPGYGARGRPEWGDLFTTYVQTREQLRRVYMLFNAKHGLSDADTAMLAHLHELCLNTHGTRFTLQSIITKADALPGDQVATMIPQMRQQIFEHAPTCLSPIITSCSMQPMFGIDAARSNILQACGLS
ncbi:hypothetical protein HGRIS_004872 [Hohenbuehelia grisea]|uniref:EngB-type G domain-containing protein n=1 Tax=Hohenbuehelia grisea TaxID=104357 RepID=A0ABR3JD89_9AGAR